jgi:glycosyltransferase involved in cell wall biosynthesis
MRLALVVDAYLPARTSAAVQMRDLARGLAAAGHAPTVIVPESGLDGAWRLEQDDGVEILRLRAPRTKDIGRLRRALAESALSFALGRALARSPRARQRWDGVVWYSPSIFLGGFVARLKRRSGCRAYLVLRDLFPDWAVDAGLLRRGLAYRYFKAVERHQYGVADVIGVQTPSNLPLLQAYDLPRAALEVLPNWLSAPPAVDPGAFPPPFPGRTTFVYAGNMGVAQAMPTMIALAAALRDRRDLGFLFVGRGTEVAGLKAQVADAGLEHVRFLDEVAPEALPALLAHCQVGLLSLDLRHRTHNIPGKLLTYLHAGLPVLASINPGNDLLAMLEHEGVGYARSDGDVAALARWAVQLAEQPGERADMGERGRALARREFSTEAACRRVLAGLQPR